MKTDAAASGFFRPACSLTVLFYDLLDFFYRNRTADMTVGVYIGRRSERCDLTVSANRFGTCMDDLRNQNTACLPDAFCKLFKLWNKTVFIQRCRVSHIRIFAVDSYSVDYNIAGAAFGAPYKNIRQLFRDGSVCCFIIHTHRSHCHSVLQSGSSNLNRTEKL